MHGLDAVCCSRSTNLFARFRFWGRGVASTLVFNRLLRLVSSGLGADVVPSKLRMLADGNGEWASRIGALLDLSQFNMGNKRTSRCTYWQLS
jgi:hypothetical protein